jgi:hypothetical protein
MIRGGINVKYDNYGVSLPFFYRCAVKTGCARRHSGVAFWLAPSGNIGVSRFPSFTAAR